MTSPAHNSIIMGALLLVVAIISVTAASLWCTFYSEDSCEEHVGSMNYNTRNDGIFQNGGPYFKCRGDEEFSLISYPPGDPNGDRPNHCKVFTKDYFSAGFGVCAHLDDFGFMTGDGGYYRLSTDKTYPSLSKRETIQTITAPEHRSPLRRNSGSERRNANYLTFFDDLGCEGKHGSNSYSIPNLGCFEDGGAYPWRRF